MPYRCLVEGLYTLDSPSVVSFTESCHWPVADRGERPSQVSNLLSDSDLRHGGGIVKDVEFRVEPRALRISELEIRI